MHDSMAFSFLKQPFDLQDDAALLKQNKMPGLSKLVQHKDTIGNEHKVRLKKCFADALQTKDVQVRQLLLLQHHKALGPAWWGEVFVHLKKTDIEFRAGDRGNKLAILNLNTDLMTKNSKGRI